MEHLVLLPKGDSYERDYVRVIGRAEGLNPLVAIHGRFIVTKSPGRSVFSGQGQPSRYSRAQFEVWEVIDSSFMWDRRSQREVEARRCVAFDKSS